jgi:hypothetical protein
LGSTFILVVSFDVERTRFVLVLMTPLHAWIFARSFSKEAVFVVRTLIR